MKYCVDKIYCPYRAMSNGVAVYCKSKEKCIYQRPQIYWIGCERMTNIEKLILWITTIGILIHQIVHYLERIHS